jgi:ABC-type transport system substrate-binding protein
MLKTRLMRRIEPMPYDPAKAKELLAEAGYPSGIDTGEFAAIPGFPTIAEVVMDFLNAAGIPGQVEADGARRSTPTGRPRNYAACL